MTKLFAVLLIGHAATACAEAEGDPHAEEKPVAEASGLLRPAASDSPDTDPGHLEGGFEETQTRRSAELLSKGVEKEKRRPYPS